MEENFEQIAQKCGKANKKVKPNQNQQEGEDGWIMVKKKNLQLSISICDFSRINRYYSHRSIQGYLRYLLSQTVPNPMWLSIKRQSLIQQIVYIDLEIQSNLFQSMLEKKELPFLASLVNTTNKALFKFNNRILRQQLWEALLCCQLEQNIQEIQSESIIQESPKVLNQQLYNKYKKYALTPEEMKLHLYPSKELPLYSDYYQIKNEGKIQQEWKNKILVVDCQMVSSEAGFELARVTVMNFEEQVLFDELFKPDVEIVNYNTQYSGITEQLLKDVTNTMKSKLYPFLETIMCEDTILVGHSLENDLRAMKMVHDKVIDSAILFSTKSGSKFKLKSLADKILKRKIQVGEHCSKEDCLATLHVIRAKIQNDQQIRKKDYKVLREIQDAKRTVAIIDHAIDIEMKAFMGNHYQKTQQYQKPENLFKIMKKYLRRDVNIPSLIMTRIEKEEDKKWEEYYQQFDQSFKEVHASIPKKTAIFLNCQVNPNISILVAGEPLKLSSSIRNPCFVLAV